MPRISPIIKTPCDTHLSDLILSRTSPRTHSENSSFVHSTKLFEYISLVDVLICRLVLLKWPTIDEAVAVVVDTVDSVPAAVAVVTAVAAVTMAAAAAVVSEVAQVEALTLGNPTTAAAAAPWLDKGSKAVHLLLNWPWPVT